MDIGNLELDIHQKKAMSTKELKHRLFEGIENIDDNVFLLTIKELIDHKYSESAIPALSAF